ncbi:MAG: DUF115 domain-containing protein [Treponema sp.]|jgi:hypothetical protein|nr:DUF115 domain-containing protein [Treponema sp.]
MEADNAVPESYWERNTALLREQYPALAERVLQGQSTGDAGDYAVSAAASGAATLTFRGIHIHSPRDPAREGRRQAETLEAGDGPAVILGFGLGYAAEALAGRFPTRPIIILERRWELFRRALEVRDLSRFFGAHKIALLIGDNRGLSGALELFAGKPAVLRNPSLTRLDAEWYAEAEGVLAAWSSKDAVNAATLRRFGKRWVRNLGANMAALRDLPGIAGLAGCLGNGQASPPALLAAAGPSLDLIGPHLAALAERCVIVAVDTALSFFLRRGVAPDFAVVMDPQFWNSRHLDRTAPSRTCLIAESAVYPSALRHPFQRAYLCSSLYPLGRYIEDRLDPKGRLGAGGSVATTAWDFARFLGAQTIWIAGLDLAFPALKTHFKGARFEELVHGEANRLSPAETWSARSLRDGQPFYAPSMAGGRTLTDKRLSLYSAWFASRFRGFPQVRSYSLSPEGLAIPGLELRSLAEALALPCRRADIRAALERAFGSIENAFFQESRAAERRAGYQTARSSLREGLETIYTIAAKTAALAETARETYTRTQAAPPAALFAQLDRAGRRIQASDVKEVAGFLLPPASELEEPSPDPLSGHLTLSAKVYRALAGAAAYHISTLRL